MRHWIYHVAAALFLFFSLCHSLPHGGFQLPNGNFPVMMATNYPMRRAAKVKLPVVNYDFLPTRDSREPNPLKGRPHQTELKTQENIRQARHRLQQIKRAAAEQVKHARK